MWSVPVHFSEFWMANTRKCEHIKHENYDLCHRNEKKFNQKPMFVIERN